MIATPLLQDSRKAQGFELQASKALLLVILCVGLWLVQAKNRSIESSVGVYGWPFWENLSHHPWWSAQPCTGVKRAEMYKAFSALHQMIGFSPESTQPLCDHSGRFSPADDKYIHDHSCYGSHRCTFGLQFWMDCLKCGIPTPIKGLYGLEIRENLEQMRTMTLWDFNKIIPNNNVIYFGAEATRSTHSVFSYILEELQPNEFALIMLYIPVLGGKNMLHMWFIEITLQPELIWRLYQSWVDKFNLQFWMGESDILCENDPTEYRNIHEAREKYGKGAEMNLQQLNEFMSAMDAWAKDANWTPLQSFLGGGMVDEVKSNRAIIVNAMKFWLDVSKLPSDSARDVQGEASSSKDEATRVEELPSPLHDVRQSAPPQPSSDSSIESPILPRTRSFAHSVTSDAGSSSSNQPRRTASAGSINQLITAANTVLRGADSPSTGDSGKPY